MNKIMRLILCVGFLCKLISFSNIIFGMEHKRITPYVPQGNLYTMYGFGRCAPFKSDGTVSDKHIFNVHTLNPPSRFKGDIVKMEDDKYYIQAKVQYGSCVEVKGDSHIDLHKWLFLVPIDITREQLKVLINIRQKAQYAGSIFAIDDKGNQFYIENIECDATDDCTIQNLDIDEKERERIPLKKTETSYKQFYVGLVMIGLFVYIGITI